MRRAALPMPQFSSLSASDERPVAASHMRTGTHD
jgi:hypothetical protein